MFDPIIRFVLMTTYGIRDAAASRRDEKGATAVEYGLLVALIAAVIVVAVGLLGGKINTAFTHRRHASSDPVVQRTSQEAAGARKRFGPIASPGRAPAGHDAVEPALLAN